MTKMEQALKRVRKSYFRHSLVYALLIVFSGNLLNHLLQTENTRAFLATYLETPLKYLVYYTSPYLHLERLAFLGEWLWLIPFFALAIAIGSLHTAVYESRFDFGMILRTCLFVSLFKLFSYSLSYGILPAFLYFLDFLRIYYLEPAVLLPVIFTGLFIGTELVILSIRNADEEEVLSKYR